ncbi:hypothetical protein ACFL04_04190 [Patescibacteria group bacterium]
MSVKVWNGLVWILAPLVVAADFGLFWYFQKASEQGTAMTIPHFFLVLLFASLLLPVPLILLGQRPPPLTRRTIAQAARKIISVMFSGEGFFFPACYLIACWVSVLMDSYYILTLLTIAGGWAFANAVLVIVAVDSAS